MKALKLFGAAAVAASLLAIVSPAQAAYPIVAEAITLKNAINNNTIAGSNQGNNNANIAYYLPRMGDCIPVYTVAKNAMDAELAYVAGGGTNVAIRNEYISQVNSALAGGDACAGITTRPPTESFNANGVKYTNVGWPSVAFVNPVITTSNNFPAGLAVEQIDAYNAGWKFYIFRTPDEFKASPLYTTLGVTTADFNGIRLRQGFTVGGTAKTQVLFEYFYYGPSIGGQPTKQLRKFTDFKPTATITHETEHMNDERLGVSANHAGFLAAYNLGVARYNAASPTKDVDIGTNFVSNTNGKSELFAELATYWDTGHWGVSGVSAQMSSSDYSAADVLFFFSEAWTLMQTQKAAGTW